MKDLCGLPASFLGQADHFDPLTLPQLTPYLAHQPRNHSLQSPVWLGLAADIAYIQCDTRVDLIPSLFSTSTYLADPNLQPCPYSAYPPNICPTSPHEKGSDCTEYLQCSSSMIYRKS